jgi:YVTN family beta-propeller protein
MTRVLRLAVLGGLSVLVGSGSLAAAADTPYALAAQWPIGGPGGWDYLAADSAGHRLFLSRGDHVDVVDTETGKTKATIPNTPGVHGVALAPKLKRGFTSNGRGNSVTVFDYDTLARIQDVALPAENPDAVLYEESTNHVYTFNGRSKDVTVLDASSLEVLAKIPVPGKPEFARSDETGHVFVNIETEPGQLIRIDSKSLKVDGDWTLKGCNSPTGLAIDLKHEVLFSVCDDKVMAVTNGRTGKALARVAIGEGPDAVEFDASTRRVLSSNGEGSMTVVQQDSPRQYRVLQTVATQKGARTMALDEATHAAYLVTAEFGPVPAATALCPTPRARSISI